MWPQTYPHNDTKWALNYAVINSFNWMWSKWANYKTVNLLNILYLIYKTIQFYFIIKIFVGIIIK